MIQKQNECPGKEKEIKEKNNVDKKNIISLAPDIFLLVQDTFPT